MHALDWCLFLGFLAYVIWDGARRVRGGQGAEDYLLAGRSVPWWGMGLSIMATQASAITLIGTTGQGWQDGLRFVQFYFALPIAMGILCFTAVPLFHRLRVSTAYEYLGRRFDRKTRLLAALLFLILRGLSVGIVIYAPAVVLSKVFGISQDLTVIMMGAIALAYTSIGGMRAVIATDVKQMAVMVIGLLVAFCTILARLPQGIDLGAALTLAGETGRLEAVSLEWDPRERYTLWSGLIGGLFLFLAYFGTDQSQAQRFLAGRSLGHMRAALIFNGICKLPFQFLVLLSGVLLFVFYLFHTPPVSFVPLEREGVPAEVRAEHERLSADHEALWSEARRAAYGLLEAKRDGDAAGMEEKVGEYRRHVSRAMETRRQARELRGGAGEVNYAFPHFILNFMPVGVVGLLLAAIFAAALSSIDSELNAMATVTALDLYRFGLRRDPGDRGLLLVSRLATVIWGALATVFALHAGQLGSVIEAVNQVGSYFYGSLLGVFVLALAVPRANGHGAFFGLLAGMAAVAAAGLTEIAFLYQNVLGTGVVLLVGTLVSRFHRGGRASRAAVASL